MSALPKKTRSAPGTTRGSLPRGDDRQSSSLHEFTRKDHFIAYSTVALSGAAVMVIELLGTRIIGPFYGAGLIVWSSLISVTLLALAVGYYTGGIFADQWGRLRLPHILLMAAVFTGIIPLISEPVQSATSSLGIRAGSLLSAVALFFVPLAFLGMVGPYVIKMASRRLDKVGFAAGSVYAVSTFGSVLGTLALGFYFLPVAGSRAILLGTSLMLVALAFCLSIYEKQRSHKVILAVFQWTVICCFVSTTIFAVSHAGAQKSYPDQRVVMDAESHYGWIRVVDDSKQGIRWLMADSSVIGAEDLATRRGVLGYQRLVAQLPFFRTGADEALLIGLGAGHLVQDLSEYGIRTDAVEIDPQVVIAAKRFFNFEPSGQLWVGDARYVVQQSDRKYDFIIHDCFTGGSEPIHLLTLESLQRLKQMLDPAGILVLNFVGFTDGNERQAVDAVARTLDRVFSYRRTFVSSPGETFTDFVFFASDHTLQIEDEQRRSKTADWLAFHEVKIPGGQGFVINDNFNPLQSLQVGKAERYRDLLIERMGQKILFW